MRKHGMPLMVAGIFVTLALSAILIAAINHKARVLGDEVRSLRNENQALRGELYDLKNEARARIAEMNERSQRLSAQLSALETVQVAQQGEVETLSFYLASLQAEQDQLTQHINALEGLLDQLSEPNEQVAQAVEELRRRLEYFETNAVLDGVFQEIYANADYAVHLEVSATFAGRPLNIKLAGLVIEHEGRQYVLTAGHIRGEGETIIRITASFRNGNIKQEMALRGYDSRIDAALLEFKDANFVFTGRVARLGDSDEARVGDPVMALGSPFGIFKWNGSMGNIMNLNVGRRYENQGLFTQDSLIMHSAIINGGNSGGPLINRCGEVIGINVMIVSDADNIAMPMPVAVPINSIRAIMDDLANGITR